MLPGDRIRGGSAGGVVGMTVGWMQEIDYVRGFAILFVLVIHTTAISAVLNSGDPLFIGALAINTLAQAAVPLFVFVSGFVLAHRYRGAFSVSGFYRRRLVRIVPPYIAFSVVYLVAMVASASLLRGIRTVPSLSVPDICYRLFSGSCHYHLWFIVLIVELYLIYPLLIRLYDRARQRSREVHLLAAALLVQAGYLIVFAPGILSTSTPFVRHLYLLEYIFYFVLGIFVFQHADGLQRRLRPRWIPVILAGLILAGTVAMTAIRIPVAGYVPVLYQLVGYPVYGLTCILCLLLGLRLQAAARGTAPFLKSLGEYSFGIYLIHPLVMEMVYYLVLLRLLSLGPQHWQVYPLLFVSGLALSLVAARLLRCLPISRLVLGMEPIPGWTLLPERFRSMHHRRS